MKLAAPVIANFSLSGMLSSEPYTSTWLSRELSGSTQTTSWWPLATPTHTDVCAKFVHVCRAYTFTCEIGSRRTGDPAIRPLSPHTALVNQLPISLLAVSV